jgi:hypothetical protein
MAAPQAQDLQLDQLGDFPLGLPLGDARHPGHAREGRPAPGAVDVRREARHDQRDREQTPIEV